MKPLKIACLGEAMIEMIANSDGTQAALGVAGDSMNTAIYLKRCLGAEHQVAYVSMVGRDAFSDRIENFIASEGVSTRLLKRHASKLPGIYAVSTDDAGERSFSYWRDASAAREMLSDPDGLSLDELSDFDVISASAISLAILPQSARDNFFDWLSDFRSKGGRFVFDSNFRPALWPDRDIAKAEISKAWQCCDIALPSVDDEMALFEDADEEAVLARLRAFGVTSGVLKRGDLGPIPIAQDEQFDLTFAAAEHVVDTTAAGDSFNGGFLGAFLATGDLAAAAQAGHQLACHVVGHRGAITPREQ